MPKSDIEIAREATMQPIAEIGRKLDIPADALLQYGPNKAKVSYDFIDSLKRKRDGKLVLVTAITPTPAGEGKTTTTVGLGDGLHVEEFRPAPGRAIVPKLVEADCCNTLFLEEILLRFSFLVFAEFN